MPLTPGTRLGPYEILTPLGAGGMGEVYRATDTKLGRDVALKVMPAEMAHDPERLARFRREAKTLAQLDHPNIVTIYSVEECDGVHFLTMQLVEGQPLDFLIPVSGLPVEQIVEIASALGDALAAAHEKGIVHRDLKPANVMLSNEGRVKVLDFGLAKDVSASDPADATLTSDHRTQAGMVMGTPAYMSPEQTSGRPLDHRTDIFSLGVMLHEMSTGRRPFEGNSSAELISAILRDTPPSVTEVRPDLPSDLARIVRRCLEKDPRHRVQTARDVSNEFRDLARQTSQKVVPAKTSSARIAAVKDSGAARADEGFWVAVLPLRAAGGDADLEALAEGLTEAVTTGLSRFPYLQVIAHNSAMAYKGRAADIRTVGRELGARYVIEGSIRKGGRAIRVSAQLMDAVSGTQLWAEAYDREITDREGKDAGTFQVQDDLTDHIVTTVADGYGVLVRSMAAPTRERKVEELSASELVLRYYAFMQQVNPQEHAALRAGLERALEREPNHATAWACLSNLYQLEYFDRFNPREKPLERAREAAWRAVKIDPACQMGWKELAAVHFFSRDFTAFRETAERAMSLNPRDGTTLAFMALMIAFSGDWERGMALAQIAIDLNRHHPGWYHNIAFHHHYRKREYEAALQAAKKINMPEFHWMHLMTAAACGMLGRHEEARTAIESLRKYNPTFLDLEKVREDIELWDPDKDEVERFLQGLQKAGMKYGSADSAATDSIATDSKQTKIEPKLKSDSTAATRADEGFWVAVLPFKYGGTSPELKALADGLSEEIVTGLSRFSYLRVIARSSTTRYANESLDVRSAGRELGARYVMEGTLRQAGSKLRIAVQLVDAVSGAHLWAENYERSFAPEAVFAVQDDLVPRIVSTVADHDGILPVSMAETLRNKSDERLTPHEAMARSFGFFKRITPEEHARVRRILATAVGKAPNHGDCWAMLSHLYCNEYWGGFNTEPDPLARALDAARRAVEAAPSNHLSYWALALALYLRRDMDEFRTAAERAIELNPMDGSSVAFMGALIAYSGDWERGCAIAEPASALNPNHAGWHKVLPFYNAFRKGEYREALAAALRLNAPGSPSFVAARAAAYGQLGELEAGQKAVKELLAIDPAFATTVREFYAKFLPAELVERLLEGLRKAGLDISDADAKPAPSGAPATRTTSGAARADEGFWVAVLPFKYDGGNADLRALAGGLTDDIVTGMSRFSYLRVIARGSSAKYSSEAGDVRAISKELGARYVMEGNLRQAGTKLRLAVQVVDAVSGTHLWAETYERTFSPENIFALQDDLVPRVVSTVADGYGILPHNICDALRRKPDDQLTPHEAVLRAFSYYERITPEEHAQVRQILERAARGAPSQCEIWAMLATIYWHEYAHGFNLQPDPLGRALAAARRSVEAAPRNNLGHSALATTLFLQKNFLAFRPAAERAIELNPMDGSNLATMGLLMAYSGDWEHGCALVESALQLNPHHPGWYWFAHFFNAYRKADYRGALSIALKFNMPGYFYTHALTAAVYGQLGMREPTQKAVQELLTIRPDFAVAARAEFEKFYDPELVEQLIDGLRKAGLEIEGTVGKAVASKASDSGSARADEGFWVAVLPFKYGGTSPELKALADGLSEEIVTGLSRFSYLRVIARSSTARYANESLDVRSAGNELGARYVMEGSLRQAGSKLRLAVQLVDAVSGAHLWAENYEHTLSREALFELQDELVPRIVSTVADTQGVLPRSMSETLRSRSPEQFSPYEAVLRSFGYFERATPEELAAARSGLEMAVQKAPAYADAWALLAFICLQDYAQGFNLDKDSFAIGSNAAQRAVEAGPSNALAYGSLAVAFFFQKEFQSFRNAAERTLALNPMVGNSVAFLGELLTYAGDWERGMTLADRAKQLNPNHPGWYWYADFYNAYRQSDYRGALNFALKVNMPGHWFAHAALAAACGQLGERDAAIKAVRELLKVRPNFAATVRKDIEKWWEPEYRERMIEGWRKAGLETAPEEVIVAPAFGTSRSSAKDAPGAAHAEKGSWPSQDTSQIKRRRIPLAVAVILLVLGAAGVAVYLKRSSARQIDSIAVLPLENRSNNPDADYIPDGITESINNSLARLPSLTVIPHSVAFHYKGKAMDVRKVGEELHVQAVLAGSVAQRGDDLTINVELDDIRSGKQLWGEQYHRKLADLLAVQSDIAREVSQRLRSQLSAEDQKKLTKGSTDNPEAYRLYLKGKYYTDKLTKEGFDTGIDYFNQAIAVDPNYGLAYSGLAYNYINQIDWFMPPSEGGPKTKDAAEKALAIDGSDTRAHLSLAIEMHWYEWKFAAAENEFKRTIQLNPNNAEAHLFYAWFLASMGRNDEAIGEARRAQQADPLFPFASFSTGAVLLFARQWDPAIEQLHRAIELDPNFWFSHCFLGRAYEQKGRLPEAIAEFQRALEVEKGNTEIWSGLGYAYAISGKKVEAHKVLNHLKELSAHGWVAPYNVAVIYAGLGEKDQAFALLEQGYKNRSYYLATYLATDERLDNLRSDPRFADLRKRVGLPE